MLNRTETYFIETNKTKGFLTKEKRTKLKELERSKLKELEQTNEELTRTKRKKFQISYNKQIKRFLTINKQNSLVVYCHSTV